VVLVVAAAWPLAHAGTALVVERDIGPPDAIIMLASHEWERLPAAAALARRYPEAIVIITIPQVVTTFTCHRCSERVDWLAAEGVSRQRVRVLHGASNTHGEALAAFQYSKREDFSRLVVVTSPYHTRRSLATFSTVFEGSGVKVGVAPASPAEAKPDRWWLDRYDRHYVRYEWAALVHYRVKYRIPLDLGDR
jgi:uncharacterized SAM-binding protein YcdF (DUF218 family)